MKEIPLSRGKVALVDNEDYTYLMQWKWYAACKGRYAARNRRVAEPGPSLVYMHKVVAARVGIAFTQEVDHEDTNSLNNCRNNIRPCTHQSNVRNRRHAQKNNSSGYKGVCWDKRRKLWRAQIQVNGKSKHVGYFVSKREAANVYNKAASKYFGDFAYLNPL